LGESWNCVILTFRQHVIWSIYRGVLSMVRNWVSFDRETSWPMFRLRDVAGGIVPILAVNGASLSSTVETGLPLSYWLF
jgi:hypothetical protein